MRMFRSSNLGLLASCAIALTLGLTLGLGGCATGRCGTSSCGDAKACCGSAKSCCNGASSCCGKDKDCCKEGKGCCKEGGSCCSSCTAASASKEQAAVNTVCPIGGHEIDKAMTATFEGKTIAFCCDSCKQEFLGMNDEGKKGVLAKAMAK